MRLLAELTKNSSTKDKTSITLELPVGRLTADDVMALHSLQNQRVVAVISAEKREVNNAD